ncbi:hypothetical protein D3C75_557340 [compost metagenome]
MKNAIEISKSRHIVEREYEIKKNEQKHLHAIEEANKQIIKQLQEYNLRKQHLVQNIENQMESWFKAQKLRDYAEELDRFVATCTDKTTKESVAIYIRLVRETAEECDPVEDILREIKALNGDVFE